MNLKQSNVYLGTIMARNWDLRKLLLMCILCIFYMGETSKQQVEVGCVGLQMILMMLMMMMHYTNNQAQNCEQISPTEMGEALLSTPPPLIYQTQKVPNIISMVTMFFNFCLCNMEKNYFSNKNGSTQKHKQNIKLYFLEV